MYMYLCVAVQIVSMYNVSSIILLVIMCYGCLSAYTYSCTVYLFLSVQLQYNKLACQTSSYQKPQISSASSIVSPFLSLAIIPFSLAISLLSAFFEASLVISFTRAA